MNWRWVEEGDGYVARAAGVQVLQGHRPGPAACECHRLQLVLVLHQELVAALRRLFGAQPIIVQIHPILIGVTGTIYKDLYDTMDLLGVNKPEAKRCAANLHRIAVSYVDKIMTTKWQQEQQQRIGVG